MVAGGGWRVARTLSSRATRGICFSLALEADPSYWVLPGIPGFSKEWRGKAADDADTTLKPPTCSGRRRRSSHCAVIVLLITRRVRLRHTPRSATAALITTNANWLAYANHNRSVYRIGVRSTSRCGDSWIAVGISVPPSEREWIRGRPAAPFSSVRSGPCQWCQGPPDLSCPTIPEFLDEPLFGVAALPLLAR